MVHPYPPHDDKLPYVGKYHYFLTFRTEDGTPFFVDADKATLVCTQLLRAAKEQQFALTTYCLMPDHAHVIASGLSHTSRLKTFVARAKQYSAFYFKREYGCTLWQRYGFERLIRDDMELALTIGYIVANPVRAALVGHPSEYPHLGSSRFTVAELLEMCDYERILE